MAASNDLVFMTARELSPLIKTKKVSPVEVTQAFLDRIQTLNPKVNAFITVTADHALEQARQAEKEIRSGKYRAPLHGIPYAPKDILATKNIRTTNGSKVTADWVPNYESTITARLQQAGAILIGKLNLLEFAMGSGVLSGFGPARNPWHLDYSPAGSSSGSGAALAARMCPLAIGTDTGGSIRGPASFCAIVGLRQTYGRVSRYGVTTLAWTLDVAGPMATNVADTAMLLQAIAGPDPKDRTASPQPVPDYSKSLTTNIKGLRVGVPKQYFWDNAHPDVDKAVHAAIDKLAELGATVVNVEIPHIKYAGSAGWIIDMAEPAAFHEKRIREHPELFDPLVRERMEAATYYPATDYIKAQRVRTILMREMDEVFAKCDVMAVPGNTGLPQKLEPAETARSDVKPGSVPTPYRTGNTMIGSVTGIPELIVPCGFSSGTPSLPISIGFYGKAFDEATLFRIGYAYESATEWHKRRPSI
jgi:aspartyl-tRNA(Asn)/glutamyl-tRNA(Gln) amidotransferase subunit A